METAIRSDRASARLVKPHQSRRLGLGVALIVGLTWHMAGRDASAQTTPPPLAAAGGPFFAVDVFGGTHPQASTSTAPNPPAATFGWEIAGTVRPRRWFGITAAVGRVRTPERAWVDHLQVGPRVSTTIGRLTDLRGFAHVVAGRATFHRPDAATATSLELMAGAGVDVFNVFRFQLDLLRRDLPTLPKTGGRFLFGAAIPLCFRGCGASDGFKVR